MASLVLVWISTVDDGHMTQLVTIAATNNISHLKETRKYHFYYVILKLYGVLTERDETN